MKLLILGGTQFVGRHITEAALARGHEVTLFNRGKTNSDLFPQVHTLIGDRETDVSALQGTHWDAVIDVNGYLPDDIARVLDAVTTRHYTFISTISVYAEHHAGDTESAALAEMPADADLTTVTGATYGPLKVACERLIMARYPDHTLIIRPGLVVGPYDHTDRWLYWLVRTAQGGTMLTPGHAKQPMQLVDARDLAAFTVMMTEQGVSDIYNVTGHAHPLGDLLNTARDISHADTEFVWVDDAFLLEQGITPWQDLPLWMPAEQNGVHERDIHKALAAGFTPRPLAETAADTWAWWQQERANHPLHGNSLNREREQEILNAWQQTNS